MKHPVKGASLPPAEIVTEDGKIVLRPGEVVAYRDNTGFSPRNFAEGTEAYDQWTYTGRKKKDKNTLQRALEIEE